MTQTKLMRTLLTLVLVIVASVGNTAEILDVSVDRTSDTYHMRSEVRFDVPSRYLFDVLTDWDLSTQFSSVVVESRNLPADEAGRPGFYARNRACVAFFCKSFERKGYVEAQPLDVIMAVADPDNSDFHVSVEKWHFAPDGDTTTISYQLEMRPKFWVPPLVGPYLIKRKLEKDGGEALARIENIALQLYLESASDSIDAVEKL